MPGKGKQTMTATFDTLSAARSLEAAGIESEQAEAIVGAIRGSKRCEWPPGAFSGRSEALQNSVETFDGGSVHQ